MVDGSDVSGFRGCLYGLKWIKRLEVGFMSPTHSQWLYDNSLCRLFTSSVRVEGEGAPN